MPTVSLTDTSSQLAELARRQKLADLLSQQGQAPIEVQSYKGTQAPIPTTAILAKVLASYLGARQGKKILDDEKAAKATARDEASTFLRDQSVDPGMALTADALKGAQGLQQPGIIDRLKGMLPQNQPPPSPAAPPPSPQALAAGLTGQPPPPPPQAMPQAPPPQAMSPQGPQSIMPPEQMQQPMDPARQRSMPEQQDRLLQATISGNPYLEKLAPTLYARNQAVADRDEGRAYDDQKFNRDLEGKALLQRLKPEERPAFVKEYEAAKAQGFQGDMVAYHNAIAPPVSVATGTDVYRRSDINGTGQPAMSGQQLEGLISQSFPGAQITSRGRTPAQNAAVGGVSNSAHLDDHARDFVLGSPQAMVAAAAQINAQGLPGVKAIFEGAGSAHSTGPHVHVQITGGQGGAPTPVARGRERPANAGAFGGQWSLTPEEDAALTKAAAEGRVDPTRLNSRTAKIQAKLFQAIPGYDAMGQHADANLRANPGAQQKAMLAAALPEVLANVRDAGKKLQFSDAQFIGKLQAFGKGQLNDPDFIEYMTQRNDAMQTLAQVMSGVGATDMRTKMETEAAPKTMSPKAWDAWYNGQLRALQPRIEAYEKRKLLPPGSTPGAAKPYADPEKERRYQEWLKAHPHG